MSIPVGRWTHSAWRGAGTGQIKQDTPGFLYKLPPLPAGALKQHFDFHFLVTGYSKIIWLPLTRRCALCARGSIQVGSGGSGGGRCGATERYIVAHGSHQRGEGYAKDVTASGNALTIVASRSCRTRLQGFLCITAGGHDIAFGRHGQLQEDAQSSHTRPCTCLAARRDRLFAGRCRREEEEQEEQTLLGKNGIFPEHDERRRGGRALPPRGCRRRTPSHQEGGEHGPQEVPVCHKQQPLCRPDSRLGAALLSVQHKHEAPAPPAAAPREPLPAEDAVPQSSAWRGSALAEPSDVYDGARQLPHHASPGETDRNLESSLAHSPRSLP